MILFFEFVLIWEGEEGALEGGFYILELDIRRGGVHIIHLGI